MAKSKISKEMKIAACKKYLKCNGSYKSIGKEIGVADIIIKRWVLAYKSFGEVAFDEKESNTKYTLDFKLSIINKSKGNSINDIASMNGISPSVVRNWIKKYNEGELKEYTPCPEVYSMKSRKTTFEERIQIVKWVLDNNNDYKGAASQYVVPYSLVYQWTKKYLEKGKDALKDSRGRPSSNEHKELTELEKKDIEIEKLKLELDRHKRAEEILKKNLEIRQRMMKDSLK